MYQLNAMLHSPPHQIKMSFAYDPQLNYLASNPLGETRLNLAPLIVTKPGH